MRVLHVITGLRAGGAEQQLRLLLRHLPGHHRCEVAVLTAPGAVADGIRADGTPVHHLGMRGNRDAAVLPRLTGLVRRGRFDVVHTHLYRACLYGRLAARLAGVRAVVATEHSLLDGCIEGRPATRGVRALYLAAERLGSTTVAVSDDVRDRLAAWGVPPHRLEVLPNGVDAARHVRPDAARAALRRTLRDRLGLPQEAHVVGAVGRLVPGKRFDVLVDALALLAARRPAGGGAAGREPWLLLVGDGPGRAPLEARARAAGVARRTVFAGERDDVPDLLTAVDVLAAPSDAETFGLAVLEGLAAGLPVRYGSCPALDRLPPGAAPGARRLPPDPAAYADALAAPAGRRPPPLPQPPAVHHYDIARTAAGLGALYDRVGAPRRPAPAPARR
ncbi:glycosyltransferase [Streptacidiphilus sp. ASG 303]|uniref:glycosyltransferase n=1 Tax=Streptacidiphilus sp. ASG 303 TaxID=2896847 RepID=UPI001E64A1B0|nr:glycosyltransferase [Streptacidiphilus sp. ASG 303]MCD0483216.1 glycosyltransferase [Streptacidiphilus sp. ASG 303]